jgi:cytochrome c556
MPAKNRVEQKVTLDSKGYEDGHKKVRKAQQETTNDTKRNTQEQAKQHEAATEKIKKKNLELTRSLRDVAKEFRKNLVDGTVITAGAAGVKTLKDQYTQAARSVLSLDQGMARLQSRFDMSKDKAKNLRKELQALGAQTGVSGGLLSEAAEELMAANKNRDATGINSIGKFAAMGGGDPKEIARTVIDYLKGSGQKLTEDSVKDMLTSATAISRGGDLSLGDALKSLSIDPQAKAKLGLSNRENAAMIAAASGVGQDRTSSISGLNAVLAKSVGGFGEGAALAGILGVKGGGFLSNGKFDISKLKEASQNLNRQGLGKADFTKLMEASGLSGQESEGLYSILKDFDQFEGSFKKVLGDQKTLEQSFSQSTDNLKDAFARLSEKISKAATEIISPLSDVAKEALNGNFSGALSATPGALKEAGQGVMDNKAMVALGIGATALTGALAAKLGKIIGGDKAGGLVTGTAMGMALKQAGVTPVYVVNAMDMRSDVSTTPSTIIDLIKGKGGTAGTAAAGGLLAKYGGMLKGLAPMAGNAGLVGLAGAAGYGIGHYAVNPLLDKFTQGKTSEGFEGNIIEQVFFKLDQLLGGEGAENIKKANKLQLEIVDNGERFTARPKAGDLPKNNIGK